MLSGKTFTFPRLCACCAQPSETEFDVGTSRRAGRRIVRTQTKSWTFPYCTACKTHVQTWESAHSMQVVGAFAVFGILFAMNAKSVVWTILFAVVAAGGFLVARATRLRARQLMSASCPKPTAAVEYVGWDGTMHTFDLASEPFALRFMDANRGKLLNLTHEAEAKLNAFRVENPRPREAAAIRSTTSDRRGEPTLQD